MFVRRLSRVVIASLSSFASIVFLSSPLFAQPKQTPAATPKKVSKPPKCPLMGTWRGNVTIPDGADGVAGPFTLKVSGPEASPKISGSMNQKPLTISDAKASCSEVSFNTPGGTSTVAFAGKVSGDGGSLSGTAKRNDAPTSWTLQRQ